MVTSSVDGKQSSRLSVNGVQLLQAAPVKPPRYGTTQALIGDPALTVIVASAAELIRGML